MNKWFQASGIGELGWRDLFNTIILSVSTLVLNWLAVQVGQIHFTADPVVNQGIIGMLSFVISYLLKNLGTDKSGNFLGVGVKSK